MSLLSTGGDSIVISRLQGKRSEIRIETPNSDFGLLPTEVLRKWIKCQSVLQMACPQKPTVTINMISPSLSSTDHWDANSAGSRRDEGLRVLWSAREEESHQVSMLSQPSQLLAKMNCPSFLFFFHLCELLLQRSQLSCCHFLFSHTAQRVVRQLLPHLLISKYGDTPHLYLKTGWDKHVRLWLLAFEWYSSASFIGKCTWRTFQNRSYLARWAECVKELTWQMLWVSTWTYF